jgi:hypothetical protein
MEIVKNRYGNERVIEKIGPDTLRIMGESEFSRGSEDAEGNQTMFDFEGGPCLNVGGKIRYMKTQWTILEIKGEASGHEGLCSVKLKVKL